jgi:hypothetical protein
MWAGLWVWVCTAGTLLLLSADGSCGEARAVAPIAAAAAELRRAGRAGTTFSPRLVASLEDSVVTTGNIEVVESAVECGGSPVLSDRLRFKSRAGDDPLQALGPEEMASCDCAVDGGSTVIKAGGAVLFDCTCKA